MRRMLALAAAAVVGTATLGLVGVSSAQAAVTSKKVHENAPPLAVNITAAGNDGAATFSGLNGQTVTVSTSAGTFASNCDVLVSLQTNAGANLTTPVCGGQAVTLPATALTANATFKVFLDVQGSVTGSVKVAVAGTGPKSLTPGAPKITLSVPASTTLDWGFQLAKGVFLFADITATTPVIAGCAATAAFLKPDASTLAGPVCLGSGVQLDRGVTAAAGVHKLRIANTSATAFTLAVTLTSGKDTTGTITPGTPLAVPVSIKGQMANRTFSGAIGQTATVSISGSTMSTAYLSLVRPDGSTLTTSSFGTGAGFVDFTASPLDAAGTWTLRLDPYAAVTGTATLNLALVNGGGGSTITPGTPVTVSIGTTGATKSYTFTGTAGQRATLYVSAADWRSATGGGGVGSGFAYANLYRPDDTYFATFGFASATPVWQEISTLLDVNGTWTLTIDPSTDSIGSQTMTLGLVTDTSGTITPGTAKSVSIGTKGVNSSFTFTGTAGQRPTLDVSAASWTSTLNGQGYAYASLSRPDGSYFGSFGFTASGASWQEINQLLDASGTWTLTIDPYTDSTGSQTMILRLVTDTTGTITPGTAKTVTISTKGVNSSFTFTGTTGQRPTLDVSASSWTSALDGTGYAYAHLYRPDGSYFGSFGFTSSGAYWQEINSLLDASGTWTLTIDPYTDSTGSQTMILRPVTDTTGTITPGTAKTVTISTKGVNSSFTFTGTTGQRPTLDVSAASWTSALSGTGYAYAYLYRPDGSYFASFGFTSSGAVFQETYSLLDATGTWTLGIDPYVDSTGSQTMTLRLVTDLTGTLTLGTAKTVTISTKGQNARYTFSASTGKVLAVNVTGSTYANAYLILYRPDGSQFTSLYLPPGATSTTLPALDAAGTWAAVIDPYSDATGTMSLKLT